ncbi:N-acyl homoserine lactonase family protein [Actinomycetospora sp. OC33-EN08]|uniref:N-acyl homoserine lactonase family protein n=1 Tax=Actinomycetospora aurantiaca TaxID=3129233 RepID=A0ABU8MTH9_9PSEU
MASGDIKVSILDCGAMSADLTWLLLQPGRSIKPRQQKDAPAEWVDVPTHCVLVETPDGTLLWDTSCPSDWEERWGPTGLNDFFPYDRVSDDEYLDKRLEQLGIGTNQIDYVVLSHLHFDHCGNANLFKDSSAKLVCSDKEKEFAFGFDGPFTGAHLKSDYENLNWETVSGDTEFLPGVTLLQTPGHTPGCMSMQVDLPDTGTMIFTSDAVYMGASYGPPPVPAAIVNNLESWFSSVEKVRDVAERTNATVVFGHDANQIHELKTVSNGGHYT